MTKRFFLLTALFAALAIAPASAQQSTRYKITEWVHNEGGRPAQGTILASTSYHVRLDAIGDSVSTVALASPSYHADTGFVGAYPAPDEIQRLLFADKTTMTWRPDRSIGTYNVYRGLVSSLPGLTFGTCFAPALTLPAAQEPSKPTANTAWFYLVTAKNRLREEGTKGYRSNGAERGNLSPCP